MGFNLHEIYEIFYDRTKKRWSFHIGDCLINATAWAGLTVCTR
jgi:hypothetical protein